MGKVGSGNTEERFGRGELQLGSRRRCSWIDGLMMVPVQPLIGVEFRLLCSAMGSLPENSEWVTNVTKADVSKEISLGC